MGPGVVIYNFRRWKHWSMDGRYLFDYYGVQAEEA